MTACPASKNCGSVDNGCNTAMLVCGTMAGGCPAGQTCGGGGTPNVCGAPPCVPQCNKACGAEDGCGNTCLTGSCPPGQTGATCGGGGVPGACGCTPHCAGGLLGDSCGDNGCGGTCLCAVGLFCTGLVCGVLGL
jgi:hypothetical protein